MARRLLVLWAGRHQRSGWEELAGDYRKRIEHELPIEDRCLKIRSQDVGEARLRAEARAFEAALPDPCWSIALDRKGKRWSSEELAAEWSRLHDEWPHPIAFLVGSDLGLHANVVRRARACISFGPMTFGHELARLMLYEQIYRAISIRRGIKYHRPSF